MYKVFYIYILELTIGYESNLQNDAASKRQKYENLIKEQQKHEKVKFVNLSISSLGVFIESLGFIEMLKDLKFHEKCTKYFVRKIIRVSGPPITYSACVTKNGAIPNYYFINNFLS